jgi:hypothetical protein
VSHDGLLSLHTGPDGDHAAAVREWFQPERPGPLVGPHILGTGHGAMFADRWPSPRAILAGTGGNWALRGDPGVLTPGVLAEAVHGFVDASESFLALLHEGFEDLREWGRVVQFLPDKAGLPPVEPGEATIRRLTATDAELVAGLDAASGWISVTWGGPEGLATSCTAFGALFGDRLVAVACPFYVGEQYEDIAVVTEPAARRRGLSTACATAVCADIRSRGRIPSWTTSTDNQASLGVAANLGFLLDRRDVLYVTGVPIPGVT